MNNMVVLAYSQHAHPVCAGAYGLPNTRAITVISKIAPGAIVPCIDVRRFEAKANHDWLTGEAHTERFLSCDAIHARMQKLHVH